MVLYFGGSFYERNHLKDANVQLDKALVMCNSSKRVGARVVLQAKMLKAMGYVEDAAEVFQ